jgi:hypothetical protein
MLSPKYQPRLTIRSLLDDSRIRQATHMTKLELWLTSLAETTAVGRLVDAIRHGIEQQTGTPVVSALNYLPYFSNPGPAHRPAPAQARIAA